MPRKFYDVNVSLEKNFKNCLKEYLIAIAGGGTEIFVERIEKKKTY